MRVLRLTVVGLAVAGALAGCSSQPAGELTPGQCFDLAGATAEVSSVTVVGCAKAHDAEAYARFDVSLATFSADALAATADAQCLAALEPYVGHPYDASAFYYRALMPAADGWDKGARTVVCFVVPTSGSLEASVKKAAG